MSALTVENLTVRVEAREVVKNFSLIVRPGEIHALMGPNGSGKSSLAAAILGHPSYTVTEGTMRLGEVDLTALPTEARARHGLFLSFQEPPEVGGVSMRVFLNAIRPEQARSESGEATAVLTRLGLQDSFLSRFLNEGFSGGEKKKSELLQFLARNPKVAIFDEIDSGLDVDALETVSRILAKAAENGRGLLLISHTPRLFARVKPQRVHILMQGRTAASGGPELLTALEEKGYAVFVCPVRKSAMIT